MTSTSIYGSKQCQQINDHAKGLINRLLETYTIAELFNLFYGWSHNKIKSTFRITMELIINDLYPGHTHSGASMTCVFMEAFRKLEKVNSNKPI